MLKTFNYTIVTCSICLTLNLACQPNEKETVATTEVLNTTMIASGDIIITNQASDSALLFNSAGVFKEVLFELPTVDGEALTGISENTLTGEILIAVDGTPDRVIAINKTDLTTREYIKNIANFSGNIRGVAYLTSGETLAVETSNVEKFDTMGYRVTLGGWPKALQTTATGLDAMPNAGFVLCSTGTDAVRTYDADGTQLATATSGIASTTDAANCRSTPDGGVVVSWSGTTDTIKKYSSDLNTTIWSYSNTSVLANPTGVAARANGNILVLDSVLNHVVEIRFDGSIATGTILKGADIDIDNMLSSPQFIYVVK